MIGPYKALQDGRIRYVGNKVFSPIEDIKKTKITGIEDRVNDFVRRRGYWSSLVSVLNEIYKSVVDYFENKVGAVYIFLPLTTRMISSPGAVYGKEAIDYTQDTVPIKLQWFDLGTVFLSESSQLYLELSLVIEEVDHVFSIYNSFRKEEADATHLSEFHHIEYEGHVDQQRNEKIARDLTKQIISDLLENKYKELLTFLTKDDLEELEILANNEGYIRKPLKDVLKILLDETGDKRYEKFTSQYWGAWEEVFITNYFDKAVIVSEFPMKEVAFYHKPLKKVKDPFTGAEIWVVDNADFIFPGYREYIGSGHRIETIEELEWKAAIFNLPKEDYRPYYEVRMQPTYRPTSGFGMGLERLVQGILKLPTIVDACLFPRVHFTIIP